MRAYVERVATAIHRDAHRVDRHRLLAHRRPRRSRTTFVPIRETAALAH